MAWHYFNVGQIERKTRSKVIRFQWQAGYARVTAIGHEQPYVTRRQAQTAAREHGQSAKFHATEQEARAALTAERGL